jgi:hypothetical protein
VILFFVAVLLIRRAIERREARHWGEEHPDDAPDAADAPETPETPEAPDAPEAPFS